jgi:hypothetical protein
MALLSPFFATQFFDNAGLPAAGYLLHTYDSGTTNDKTTYQDQAGTVANTNPIVLDSAGRCLLWLGTGEYTFVLSDPNDVVIETWDDVAGVPAAVTGSYLPLAGGTMTGLITLSGNATSALNPTPLQQVTALIAASAPASPVTSVFGRTGAVAATAGDYAVGQITGAVASSEFTGSNQLLAASGYQKFPGGLIVQWTTATISGPSSTAVTWPIAFPTACYGALVTANGSFAPSTSPTATVVSTTGCTLDCASGSDTPAVFIVAIGK